MTFTDTSKFEFQQRFGIQLTILQPGINNGCYNKFSIV